MNTKQFVQIIKENIEKYIEERDNTTQYFSTDIPLETIFQILDEQENIEIEIKDNY